MLQCMEKHLTRRENFAYSIVVKLIRGFVPFIAYKSPEISVNNFVLDYIIQEKRRDLSRSS